MTLTLLHLLLASPAFAAPAAAASSTSSATLGLRAQPGLRTSEAGVDTSSAAPSLGRAGSSTVTWSAASTVSAPLDDVVATASTADELIDDTPVSPSEYDAASAVATATTPRGWRPLFGMAPPGRPVQFDIPISDHEDVQRWIRHFQGRGQRRLLLWMSRAAKVAPTYYEVLDAYGVPRDLLYLSMIESGFSTRAYSWAHAVGPWQFIPGTARRFNLACDVWVDERRDVDRSTVAAARYLKILYDEFQDWFLAWAAYNAGEARVRRAIRRAGTSDFWRLIARRQLPRETSRYVPKLIAAAMVSKEPERYGLPLPVYLDPVRSDVVTVTVATDLETIARACGEEIPTEEIIELNPALYREITPPGRAWPVRVPKYWGHDCARGLAELDPNERWTYRMHWLKRSDTPESLAERYDTSVEVILSRNEIEASQLANFEAIVIPVPYLSPAAKPAATRVAKWRRSPPYTPDSPPVRIHRVRSGDSLWRISQRYRVSMRSLRAWNGLWRRRYLRIGERLIIRRRGG